MLTNNLLSCYNHLLATSLLYFTVVDPLRDIATMMNIPIDGDSSAFTMFALASTEEVDQDYYEILGVSKDATKHDIHKAFRSLAKKYHPDRNKEKGAQDQFIKIFKAYETLSDEKKRKEYDNRGQEQNHGSFHNWHSGMSDFDINNFFKQYEEQMYRHAQHFQHHQDHHNHHTFEHNANHQKSFYHGVDLDDLFHDIDEDEFSRLFDISSHLNHHDSFDGSFGDGSTFFGNLPYHLHETVQQGSQKSSSQGGYTCHTTTRVVNGAVMTQTSCG